MSLRRIDRYRGLLLSGSIAVLLLGCGDDYSPAGGQLLDDASTTDQTSLTGVVALGDILSGAAVLDSREPSAPFVANLAQGVAAVSISSPPIVNFSLRDTRGRSVTGLQAGQLRFAIAKLVPGTPGQLGIAGTGDANQWVSYIYRTKSGTAVTDGVQATFENGTDGSLVFNEEGAYYSYTFATDITTSTRPDDPTLLWDPAATHRLAIQLDLEDSEGNRILFNPHFDFRFAADGVSVPLTDTALSSKISDEGVCNGCHDRLVAHGARVETEYCVMCHNAGSIDVEFGSDIDFKVMIHKIHKGRALVNPYQIAGFGGEVHDWSEVGYPQDLRNCRRCHDGANPQTPQGDNWRMKPTQQACGACHEEVDFNDHQGVDWIADDGSPDNSGCRACHAGASTSTSAVHAHFNQADANSNNYRFNLLTFDYDPATRELSVRYSITDPADDSPYNLLEGLEECLADVVAGIVSASSCRDIEGAPFSRFSLTIGALTVSGADPTIDDYTDHSASLFAWQATDNGDGSYSAAMTVPEAAVGTARFLTTGQAQERRITDILQFQVAQVAGIVITETNADEQGVDWDWANRVRVPIANVVRDFSVDGSPLKTRRQPVADANCNSCHGRLGTASGSNTLANAFHRGERSSVLACPVCHTPNRASSTEMADEPVEGGGVIEPLLPGTTIRMNQSFEFKNMIHGIHGGDERVTPFLHGTDDLSGLTHFPGVPGNCANCHQNESFLVSRGRLGTAVTREDDLSARHIFSPWASSCMGCHDSDAARQHMSEAGQAAIGDFTQQQWLDNAVLERCGECHGPGGSRDVSRVHALVQR